jgi:hypothetical protein
MRRVQFTSTAIGAAIILTTAFALPANATTISMADLLAGGSIVCGDKTFGNFHNFGSTATGGADAPTAAQIFATDINCGTNNPGLLWNSGVWNVNAPNQTIDTFWSYRVSVNPGSGMVIGDADMQFLSATADNGADIHITDSFFDSNGFVDSLLIDLSQGPQTDHHILFPPGYAWLDVNKDVSLESHALGNASLSTFTQNFSQVPEPATLSLIGVGLLAFGFASRRRSRKPQ